jgi:hypothetical protein
MIMINDYLRLDGADPDSGNASLSGQSNTEALAKGVQAGVDLDQFSSLENFLTPDEPYGDIGLQPFQTIGTKPVFQVRWGQLAPRWEG